MRLNRFLAQAGIASRRKAEAFILEGRVTVNGAICSALATNIEPSDLVRVDGRIVRAQSLMYVLLNKPPGYVTTRSDERSRRTIYDLLPPDFPNLSHVGRLDIESTGLILLTNDGDLALLLTHPRYHLEKEYLVHLDRDFNMEDMPKVRRGVYLAEGRARFDALYRVNSRAVRVVLTQGINRQVRRVFAALGYKVLRLRRLRIGLLREQGLHPGAYRMLTAAEVAALRRKQRR